MIKNKKTTSRFMSVLSAVIAVIMLSTTVLASGVLSDLTTDDYTIEILSNGEKIELTNKPFIENGEVYVPIRETLEKAGVTNNTQSYIEWNNGKIKICLAYDENILHYYHIEIGNQEMYFEQGKYLTKIPISFNAPILEKSLTYISYSMIDCMLRRDWLIDYNIYDKNGNIIEATNQATVIKTSQYDNTTPEYTVDQFFYSFGTGDFENMKRYCTQNCINTFFKDDAVFGMKKANLTEMNIDPLEYAKSSNGFNVFVSVNMTPGEKSVFDPSETSTSFYVILQRQTDGRYLIDEFATGL